MNSTAIYKDDTAGDQASGGSSIPAFLAGAPSNTTVIGEDSVFEGDFSMRVGQDLVVNGCVVGSIFHAGKVVIGAPGVVIGSIYAGELEVHGMVDASQGVILATTLKSHSTSHINAAKATVVSGGLSYERGAFLNANLGMESAEAVADRLDALLKAEDEKAEARREAIAHARRLHQPVVATVPAATAAPSLAAPVSNVSSILGHQSGAAPTRAFSSASDLVSASSSSVLADAAASNELPASALTPAVDRTFAAALPGIDDDHDESSLDAPAATGG
jgi:cytoskeletal protein CcmA (bactofilin family)